jgi:2-hydroxy-3-keto-5-methylthiopentenyl-1-phosphate phosphatase
VATISVVFDFDGTLVTSFIGGLLFRGFTPEAELEKASNRFKTNVTSLREYQEEVFDLVSESTAEMSKRAVEGASIRSQAHEVCEHIWNVGGKVAIASAGLDFYIQPVLDNSKLGRINVHSGKVISNVTELPPFRYDYPSSDDQCEGDWITCKCKVINDMKSEDGKSKSCLSVMAQVQTNALLKMLPTQFSQEAGYFLIALKTKFQQWSLVKILDQYLAMS